jgi:hypothetical protein
VACILTKPLQVTNTIQLIALIPIWIFRLPAPSISTNIL